MNCSRAHKLLEDLSAGRLERPPVELDKHLLECAACRGLRQGLDELEDGLRQGWPDAAPAPALKSRVLASVRQRQAAGRPGRLWWAAACAAALVVVAVLLTHGNWTRFMPGGEVSVRFELPEGTRLTREPEMVVVKAVDR